MLQALRCPFFLKAMAYSAPMLLIYVAAKTLTPHRR